MGPPLKPVSLAEMRAIIARGVTGDGARSRTLGAVTLLPSQLEAVRRGSEAIARFGGVLIADDVGTGKTFVALALGANAARPIVFGPAVLRAMWHAAAERAGIPVPFMSVESLGRGRLPPAGHDFVIVDEAHHLRNPATRRYQTIRGAVAGARIVLLTATPIHNRARDLDALLALVLGPGARDLDDAARAQVIVRSAATVAGPQVIVHPPTALRDVPEVLGAIRALPSALTPRDGGKAPVLLRMSLLRAWCSSAGALAAMLRRASLQAAALADALRAGRHPTRTELGAWATGGDGQLAFAEIVTQFPSPATFDEDAATAHMTALSALRGITGAQSVLDDERAALLLKIASAHEGMPVLACTQYAATADALWARLRLRPGVAALTSRGGRIASGPVTRDHVLDRFAPIAQGAREPHPRERVHLLVTTDLVSEGLNLHDAGVVVHLDLPWTAARLAQRVGRVARLGSPHDRVHSYTLAPPRAAAALLALERRLRVKRRVASRLVGGGAGVSALLGGEVGPVEGPADAQARILALLARYENASAVMDGPVVCAVTGPADGWLALVASPDDHRLVIRIGRAAATTDPRAVVRGIEWLDTGLEARQQTGGPEAIRDALRWCANDRGRGLSGAGRRHAAREHGRTLGEATARVGGAAPHERARAAGEARDRLMTSMPRTVAQGAERLVALVVFSKDDQAPDCPPVRP